MEARVCDMQACMCDQLNAPLCPGDSQAVLCRGGKAIRLTQVSVSCCVTWLWARRGQ